MGFTAHYIQPVKSTTPLNNATSITPLCNEQCCRISIGLSELRDFRECKVRFRIVEHAIAGVIFFICSI